VINAVTTWQAYNQWGGYASTRSDGRRETRSRAVSTDAPTSRRCLAGQFLQFELAAVRVAEHAGIPQATPRTSTCTPTGEAGL
jgi:hypothetical protein